MADAEHFYVAPNRKANGPCRHGIGGAAAPQRKACGKPPHDPIHLTPPNPAPVPAPSQVGELKPKTNKAPGAGLGGGGRAA